jgi:hypothetical protein
MVGVSSPPSMLSAQVVVATGALGNVPHFHE